MKTGALKSNGTLRKRWCSFMNKRKKKKFQNKMKVVMYCRVGTPEQLLPDDRKKRDFNCSKEQKSIDKLTYLVLNIDSSKHL